MNYIVEISGSSQDMTVAKLGNSMSETNLCKLILDLEDACEASCVLQDGTTAVVRKENVLDTFSDYEVVLTTTIPVSTQIFVMANDEESAKAIVQKLLAEKKIFEEDFLNFSEGMESGFQYWVEQTEVDDWRVQDIYPKLSP